MNSLTYFEKKSQIINTDLNNNIMLIKEHSKKENKKEIRYENIILCGISFFLGLTIQKKLNKKNKQITGSYNSSYEKKKINQSIIKVLYTFIETKLIHNIIK